MSPSSEVWVGELPVNTRLDFGSERLRLLFTNTRILVAHGGKIGWGGVTGTNILGGLSSALEGAFKRGKESLRRKDLSELAPDQVLHAHKDNFDINYSEVVSVTVAQTSMLAAITILTGNDKFEFSSRTKFENIIQLFKSSLGDKLTVHRIG